MTKAKTMITCIVHLFIHAHICAFIFVYEREKKEEGEMGGGSQREEGKGRDGVGRGERKGQREGGRKEESKERKKEEEKGMSSNYLFVSFSTTLTKSNFFFHGIDLTEAQEPSRR